jgi:hypothetical protein
MKPPEFAATALTATSAIMLIAGCAVHDGVPWPPNLVHSTVATTLGGYHSTTRGTIRLVFPHEGKWLVFRGKPDTYHFSQDGKNWSATEAPQASRSHLIRGSDIFTFYTVLVEPAPKWVFDSFICRGVISGNTIEWEPGQKLDTGVAYYPDLHQDSRGHFTMTGRHPIRNDENEVLATEVLWKRSKRPGDISQWDPDIRCINHVGDRGGPGDTWKRVGSTAHENLVLEDGKSYVIAMMTVDGVGKLYGNLFDGEKWGDEDTELASGMSTWAGTDRRMCAVFDKTARTIHLGYVDGLGNLWYRSGKSPYGPGDWSRRRRMQECRTFTVVLSLDTSQRPAHVYVLYGKTLHEDRRDLRNTWGALYLQRFDGRKWSDPVLVSEPGTEDNWYPNMNADVSGGIGVLYLKALKTRSGEKPALDIMFTSTGAPPKGAEPR